MTAPAIDELFDLALQHHQAGRLQDAEKFYQIIIAKEADHAGALEYLGVIASQTGRSSAGIDLIRRAIAINPNRAETHYNLGLALKQEGRLDEAIVAYRQAIALNPGDADIHNNLGIALRGRRALDEAAAAFRRGIALNPNSAELQSNLGNVLLDKGQFDEAIAAHLRAIALNPAYAEAHSNLGIALGEIGKTDESIAAHLRAIALRPSYAEAHSNLGIAFEDKGQLDEAIAAHRRAIAINPNYAAAHLHLAFGLQLRGDWDEGWSEMEWRWKVNGWPAPRPFVQPCWGGEELNGQTVLVHAEQGHGDVIQMLRYLPLLAGRGARVVLEVQPRLKRIAERAVGAEVVIAHGEPLPAFDFHCPMFSLPRAFNTRVESIPASFSYLSADAEVMESWRRKLAGSPAGRKVALVWAGNPVHKKDRRRSMPLSALAPLARVSGIQFYSLQKGEAGRQALNPPEGMSIIDRTGELGDFSDTAGLIAQMDLVISVDTATAHLAGAMGKPVWLLLPFVPDWRWLLNRDDSPWYPTMRLFRQTVAGDWDGVIRRVVEELVKLKRG